LPFGDSPSTPVGWSASPRLESYAFCAASFTRLSSLRGGSKPFLLATAPLVEDATLSVGSEQDHGPMISPSVVCGSGVVIHHPDLVNLYGCQIGDGVRIGAFVEIQKNARIGKNCKISSHSFICEGVTIEDEVFVGHGVMFTNDVYPRAVNASGELQTGEDWTLVATVVRRGASIGSNATILPGIEIGEGALVGAGAVVTRDVAPFSIVAGSPARVLRQSASVAPERLQQGRA
jgi:acetyltransferase-like isoleucine patch superfamily enzyme